MPPANLLRLSGRWLGGALELAFLSALILVTHCANYRDVFVAGKVYFVDPDCYARMTRARLVAEHPGTVVRRHDFENFPAGVVPHTTAPLDDLIAGLAGLLRPFTAQPLDLAGALISPLLALAGGWFLWWWARAFCWAGRWAALLVYSLGGILVHGMTLGRPDHQALLILTLLLALAAEWKLQQRRSRGWSILGGLAWGLSFWVSLYEPIILFGAFLLVSSLTSRARRAARPRWIWWGTMLAVILLAALIERRGIGWPLLPPGFTRWSATIGELHGVSLTSPLWLQWSGGLILLAPFLLPLALRRGTVPLTMGFLLGLTFALTLWEARWGYFFALLFALTLPGQLAVVRQTWLRAAIVGLSLLPFLQFWDGEIWPNESRAAQRAEERVEMMQWRQAAGELAGLPRAAVMTPWWLAPATTYWSGQPAVAGSAHEGLAGVVESARFFLATSPEEARAILQRHRVGWVLAFDGARVAENSAAILGVPAPADALCVTLSRTPSQAPPFLILRVENETVKLYQVRDLR